MRFIILGFGRDKERHCMARRYRAGSAFDQAELSAKARFPRARNTGAIKIKSSKHSVADASDKPRSSGGHETSPCK
jgi:hypothetical protein